jgi:hypothetical protein
LKIGASVGLLALGSSAWAANDLDVVSKATPGRTIDAHNMELVGWNDNQGRLAYHMVIQNQLTADGQRVIAYVGNFSGRNLNPLTGVIENSGTTIIDVTDPTNPVTVKHLPQVGGAKQARVCAGSQLPKGIKNHYYLLREVGSTGHEVMDVTIPENPTLVSTPITGLTATHKNYWDCVTGLAYLIVGAGATAAKPDGWTIGQHIKVFDLSDPANPKFVVDYGLPGHNPGSTTKTTVGQVHGVIAVSKLYAPGFHGEEINRMYVPYGIEANGAMQIVDLKKMLPPPYGTGVYVDPAKPTDAELLQSEIGRITAPGAIGGHTSWPVFDVFVEENRNFSEYNTLDLVMFTSEETSNRCQSAPHNLSIIDATREAVDDSSAEQHPWPISSVTVSDFSGKPNYCSRGTRFGVHSTHENFNNDLYRKLVTSAWFDAGIRVTDIRDPYNPKEVAYFVYPINAGTVPSNSTVDGIAYSQLDVSCDNTEVDDDNYIYCPDRVGGGVYITRLTGEAAAIVGRNNPGPPEAKAVRKSLRGGAKIVQVQD